MGFFDGIGSALVGGAAGLLGANASDESSAKAAAKANKFTKEQLQNRHQWEVEDLKKAGLNPMLSAGAAPSIGSSAKADVTNKAEAISKNVSSAREARLLDAQLENIKEDTEKKRAEKNYTDNLGARAAQDYRINQANEPMRRLKLDAFEKLEGVAHSAAGAARQVPAYVKNKFKRFMKGN